MKFVTIFLAVLATAGHAYAQSTGDIAWLKENSGNMLFHNLGKARTAPAFESDGYWVWGSSVIAGDDGMYHMFVSRFPKSLPFHPGWMIASEIVHAVSSRPEGPYEFSDVALPARGAQYWDGRSTHNPRIFRHDGKYYLIYMGSTHPFETPAYDDLTLDSKWCVVGRANKRIGLAVADSPYGPWTRFDRPLLDTEPDTFYSYLTSNPSPVILDDGSVMMIFKGRAYTDDEGGYSGMALGVASAPSIEGPYTVLNDKKPILRLSREGEAEEDPFLWQDSTGFHVIFKDHKGLYTGEKGGGVMAHSADGIHWTLDKDAKAYSRAIEWEDGSVTVQGQLERPFILFDADGRMTHIFFATMDGPGGFENSTKSWNMVIPVMSSVVETSVK